MKATTFSGASLAGLLVLFSANSTSAQFDSLPGFKEVKKTVEEAIPPQLRPPQPPSPQEVAQKGQELGKAVIDAHIEPLKTPKKINDNLDKIGHAGEQAGDASQKTADELAKLAKEIKDSIDKVTLSVAQGQRELVLPLTLLVWALVAYVAIVILGRIRALFSRTARSGQSQRDLRRAA